MKSTLAKVLGILMIAGLLLSALSPIFYLLAPSIAVESATPIDTPAPVDVEP